MTTLYIFQAKGVDIEAIKHNTTFKEQKSSIFLKTFCNYFIYALQKFCNTFLYYFKVRTSAVLNLSWLCYIILNNFINLTTDFLVKEILIELWGHVDYERDGHFRGYMMEDERHSYCQWSGEWSISPDSVECIIARCRMHVLGLEIFQSSSYCLDTSLKRTSTKGLCMHVDHAGWSTSSYLHMVWK